MVHKFLYYLSEKAINIAQSLNLPTTEKNIQDFEKKHQIQFPEDFKKLYLKHNGQSNESGYSLIETQRLLSLDEIEEVCENWKELLQESFGSDWNKISKEHSFHENEIKNQLFHQKWIPFLLGSGVLTCIDFAPAKNGKKGQIIEIFISDITDEYCISVINPSFSNWLETTTNAIVDGIYQYDSEDMTFVNTQLYDDPRIQRVSEAGTPIYQYDKQNDNDDFHPPEQAPAYLEEISDHIEEHIGPIEMVFHEILSEYVHIDVHWVKPSDDFPYNVLITSGMSDRPMCLPNNITPPEQYQLAELMIVLPPDWSIDEASFDNFNNYWPIYFLKSLARFPHQYKTWLGHGHTIPHDEDATPIANTDFGCILLSFPFVSFPEEFLQLQTQDGKVINFYALIPIYKEEMEFKLKEGLEALFQKFDEYNISEVVDVKRPNTISDKKK